MVFPLSLQYHAAADLLFYFFIAIRTEGGREGRRRAGSELSGKQADKSTLCAEEQTNRVGLVGCCCHEHGEKSLPQPVRPKHSFIRFFRAARAQGTLDSKRAGWDVADDGVSWLKKPQILVQTLWGKGARHAIDRRTEC